MRKLYIGAWIVILKVRIWHLRYLRDARSEDALAAHGRDQLKDVKRNVVLMQRYSRRIMWLMGQLDRAKRFT